MKNTKMVAKVNKEIGGWDYRGFHIDRNKELKVLTIFVAGEELVAKTLGEAKTLIDNMAEEEKPITNEEVIEKTVDIISKAFGNPEEEVISFISKRGTEYLLQVVDDKIKAFTYEAGKKHYWTVTSEIRAFVAGLALV